jgi:alkanesulfonate monooxygenase SsuD/methylene tetrahydromethanopterin reductase-like flavin-dependent oxidoreductase (luciferase family)
MSTPTFGIFDHIEGIPGQSAAQVLKDRLELVRMADEAGFTGYHLAEHHGSDLCLAPNQELFVAAASQITTHIRMGPMVKLLPLHHPVQLVEDMCVADQLTEGRLDFGVGRGPAPVEHFWFGSDWPTAAERFEDVLGIICRALRSGEISSEGSRFYDFRTMPIATPPAQEHIPFWYPGNPVTAGRFGLNLMWPGPVPPEVHDLYAEAWEAHAGDAVRLEAPGSAPRVGCTMLLAIADDENEALDVATRGMNGLVRRTHAVHRWDVEMLGEDGAAAAIAPLKKILGSIDVAIRAGAGTAEQIRDRFAEILASGLTDYIVLQIPTGDMTFDEAKRTMDMFCSKVKPDLEEAA